MTRPASISEFDFVVGIAADETRDFAAALAKNLGGVPP
jgi:hypothetical protein